MENHINTIVDRLELLSDLKSKEFTKKMIPSSKQVYGVKTPHLKQLLKDVKRETAYYSIREKIELAIKMVQSDVFEVGQMAYDFVGNDKKILPELTKSDLEQLNYGLDNWASVDAFGVYVLGKVWRLGIVYDDDLLDMVRSENFWQRRLAVVSTVPLNRKANGGMGDADRTLMICEKVVEDYEDLVVKALSWALRELLKRDREPVVEFLNRYRFVLHNRVIREVENKLNYGLKNPLG